MTLNFFRASAAVLPLALLLVACGNDSTPEAREVEAAPAETPIADSLQKPIDKAKAVEDIAQQHKADMDKRLAEMEGVDSDDDP